MRRQVALLLCAVQFLTRLPTPPLRDFDPAWISRSARYFPLVGQMVGALSAAVLLACAQVWSGAVPALLALAAGVLLTGGFHEDGLADTADGLGGGTSPQRRLEIMKDSRLGTYGALALVLALGLKAAALAGLAPLSAAAALLAGHGAGRAAAVLAMGALPYVARGEAAKWKPAPETLKAWEIALAVALAAWPLALLAPAAAGLGLALGAAFALVPALAARRLIGGYTGDVLGAVEQAFEVGFLLGVAAALA
ncbi:MAG: adenosylcobinamide-GDP ribazoletransferase [Phenylobacterium sp.]|uniref:adenosylcobinamide-GDP ribazoletransferase n=1 Tax=Phenylobacterium sp. TaxID=1871053 RepID=UPI00391922D5